MNTLKWLFVGLLAVVLMWVLDLRTGREETDVD
jgi:hypothetical protein